MIKPTKHLTCPDCQTTIIGYSALRQHRITSHQWVSTRTKNKDNTKTLLNGIASNTPALEKLRSIKLELTQTIKDLEHERDTLHHRVLELDNIIVAYKKAIV